MLQTIGKHIQGWIAGVIIAIVAATFVLFGLEYYISRSGDQQNAVATVDGAKITAQQLNRADEAIQRNYTQQGEALNEQAKQQLRGMALQQLILNQLLIHAAERAGFRVSIGQVEQAVTEMKEFAEQGRFSPQRFQQLLANNGMTPQTFLQNLQAVLLIEQLSAGFQNSAFMLPNEAAKIYALLEQQRTFGYFILPFANLIVNQHPTEQQINVYYEKNKEKFRTPDQVKVAYVRISPDDLRQQIKIDPSEVQQYYQDNSSQYSGKSLVQVKPEIEQRLIQQKLNQILTAKSEKLADLAYTNPTSLDEIVKNLDLSLKTSALMSPEGIKGDPLFSDPKVLTAIFSDEVFKQNNNSQPIELKDGGFVVVRVAERQTSQIQPLAVVHNQISQQLQKELSQRQAGLKAFEIQSALEAGDNPKQLADKNHMTWQIKKDVNRHDKNVPALILTAVFNLQSHPAADKKSITSILLPNGDYAIIQLIDFHNADYTQASAQRQTQIISELAARWGQLDYQLFVKSALEKAKIEIKK